MLFLDPGSYYSNHVYIACEHTYRYEFCTIEILSRKWFERAHGRWSFNGTKPSR